MSFDLLAELNKKKSQLNNVVTRVTLVDGSQFDEYKSTDGSFHPEVSNRRKKAVERAKRQGFVLDLKPDLQVAEVFPHIFITSQDVIDDLDLMKSHGVTHIVNAAFGVTNVYPKHFKYLNVEALDLPWFNIRAKFPEVLEFMQKAVENGKVLVHCNAGISRSSTFVLAYMMKFHQMGFEEALAVVRKVRPIVKPNKGFQNQLQEYEVELQQLLNAEE